jgi:dolichol-phosphate mannosyltransferase
VSGILAALFVFQLFGAAVALRRLARWRELPPPLEPGARGDVVPGVTIVIPTLNEARRIAPLLDGLTRQDAEAILFVDSRSTDGTIAMIERVASADARMRIMTDDPLPSGWIGKAWALECARRHVTTRWMLTLDADTAPRPGLTNAVVAAAERNSVDAISVGPRFAGQSPLERFLQPSLLVSLLYRFAPVAHGKERRVLANGQCFLVKRDVLERAGGFAPVRDSFAEDVSLATHLSRSGARVEFLDGAHLYDVRSYVSARQMWREWGRSIDLKDANTPAEQLVDVLSIVAVQGMPLVIVVLASTGVIAWSSPMVALSGVIIAVRCTLLAALRHSYAERGAAYWLSPLSDPLAALRVVMSSVRRPTSWRGRSYAVPDGR